ncbi:MAG: hypothetical protein HC901_01460 [Bdellovibrionaceae bacterium]|nr:hypothetical protein [Pseudobdellovibrionaceae bacterium]
MTAGVRVGCWNGGLALWVFLAVVAGARAEEVLFFSADDGVHGREPWLRRSGTVSMLADVRAGNGSSSPAEFAGLNNRVVFSADDGEHGRELWISNGTVEGTFLLKDIRNGTVGSAPQLLTEVGGEVMFTANGSAEGRELWATDGTAEGTRLLASIRVGAPSSNPQGLTPAGNSVYFTAEDGPTGRELFRCDLSGNWSLVKDIRPGGAGSAPTDLVYWNGWLYFAADDGTNGVELWKSNGTDAGTVMLKDLYPGSTGNVTNSGSPGQITSGLGLLFFSATDSAGTEVWRSDGTTAGTFMVRDIQTGVDSSGPDQFIELSGRVYFTAYITAAGRELWSSNGTVGGTALVANVDGNSNSADPFELTVFDGKLWFSAYDDAGGLELWVYNPGNASAVRWTDLWPGSGNGNPLGVMALTDRLYMAADNGTTGFELYATDGTGPLALVEDIQPGGGAAFPVELAGIVWMDPPAAGYAAWASSLPPGQQGQNDDADGDRVLNKEEYAFGLNGNSSAAGNGTAAFRSKVFGTLYNNGTASAVTDDFLRYQLQLPVPARADVTYRIVGSSIPNDNPDSPTGGAGTVVLATFNGTTGNWTTGSPSGSNPYVISDTQKVGTAPRRFLYLKLTIAP